MHPELDPEFATKLLVGPKARDNKYSRGTVGFVTGSSEFPGAALLGINAALELEVGMVQYLGPKVVSSFVLSNRPEAVLGLDRADAIVVGSGISETNSDQLSNLELALKTDKPLVIDGGAMQLIDLSKVRLGVITPHAAEAERLFAKYGHKRSANSIAGNPLASAIELAEITQLVVLLKGSMSVIACDGLDPIESGPGSPHLAQAGTGDVLAGMIGALLAKLISHGEELTKTSLIDVALLANQVHSEAAEVSAAKGEFGASAICAAISDVVAN